MRKALMWIYPVLLGAILFIAFETRSFVALIVSFLVAIVGTVFLVARPAEPRRQWGVPLPASGRYSSSSSRSSSSSAGAETYVFTGSASDSHCSSDSGASCGGGD